MIAMAIGAFRTTSAQSRHAGSMARAVSKQLAGRAHWTYGANHPGHVACNVSGNGNGNALPSAAEPTHAQRILLVVRLARESRSGAPGFVYACVEGDRYDG